jgi:outer membrane protein
MYMQKISKLFSLTLLSILCIVTSLFPQERLTLEQSIAIALENNPEILTAEESVRQARFVRTQVRAGLLPTISAVGNYTRNWELPEFVFTPPPGFPSTNGKIRFRTGVENTVTAGFVLEQPIYTGGALMSGLGIASDGVTLSGYSLTAAQQQTIENVYSAFYGVLLAHSLIEVAERAVENAQVNLNQVERRYEEGAASRFELLRARVQFATIQPNLTEAQHRYELALENFKTLLGKDQESSITVEGEFSLRKNTLLDEDLESLIELAYDNRPEYRMQVLQIDINKKNIRLARSEFMPKLFFSSSLQWQALKDKLDGFTSQDFTRFSSSQINLQIPIFRGFGNTAKYQEAQVELRKSEIYTDHVRNLIGTEISAAYKSLRESWEVYQSQHQVMEQAEEGLRLAQLLYQEGAVTLLEVIDAQLAYTQASTSYYRSIYDFNTASIHLERAIGILSIKNIL